jgi:tyrosyl-tRNA synthetase
MDLQTRFELIKEVGEEIITEAELRHLLRTKSHPIAYDGFEPSGMDIHIAQGLQRAINVNKMTKAGCKFKFLVADWHAWANNKMGGNLANIQRVGKYLIEVWKACDMKMKNVEFIWVSDFVKDDDYWKKVMQISRNSTIKRIVRCGQIMGRKESDVQQASQILYPCMQAADIFHLKADITQLGMDQRKVNMLAREVGSKLGLWKPVVVSHHMLMGLTPPQGHLINLQSKEDRTIEIKMSKSIPDSSIFMTDSHQEIFRKIQKAYCPPKVINENPMIEYCKYIIFEKCPTMEIKRPPQYGGTLEIQSFDELAKRYSSGEIHPQDLKQAVYREINKLIEPVRRKIEKNQTTRKLVREIKSFKVTR